MKNKFGKRNNGPNELEMAQKAAQQLAAAPVVDLVIRVDGRTGEVGVHFIGGSMDVPTFNKVLDAAREWGRQQELAGLSAGKNGALPHEEPAGEQAAADPQDGEKGQGQD